MFLLFVGLIVPLGARAEGVTARYLENNEKSSLLELIIADPPPTSIIVKQQIPSGTRIKKTAPAAVKFAAGKGEVTWLLKAPKPGVQQIRIQYQKPLTGKKATAVIRCKSPLNGQLMTIYVK